MRRIVRKRRSNGNFRRQVGTYIRTHRTKINFYRLLWSCVSYSNADAQTLIKMLIINYGIVCIRSSFSSFFFFFFPSSSLRIHSENDWWRVRHLRTGEEGLIPWNFVAEETSVESEE